MQRPCPFCLRADRPMTREHVFARWLVHQVRGARLLASGGTPAAGPVAPTPVRISRVVAPVCAVCNAGWMSTLEVSFRRLIFARPRVGALQAPDRATLSRWATYHDGPGGKSQVVVVGAGTSTKRTGSAAAS